MRHTRIDGFRRFFHLSAVARCGWRDWTSGRVQTREFISQQDAKRRGRKSASRWEPTRNTPIADQQGGSHFKGSQLLFLGAGGREGSPKKPNHALNKALFRAFWGSLPAPMNSWKQKHPLLIPQVFVWIHIRRVHRTPGSSGSRAIPGESGSRAPV